MNTGTSQRDALTPMGCAAFHSVNLANLLTSRLGCQMMVENPIVFAGLHSSSSSLRSILLILLCICMGGVPVIENPGTSLIWMHDRFQWLLEVLERCGMKVT